MMACKGGAFFEVEDSVRRGLKPHSGAIMSAASMMYFSTVLALIDLQNEGMARSQMEAVKGKLGIAAFSGLVYEEHGFVGVLKVVGRNV
jgi:hypothetical protein